MGELVIMIALLVVLSFPLGFLVGAYIDMRRPL